MQSFIQIVQVVYEINTAKLPPYRFINTDAYIIVYINIVTTGHDQNTVEILLSELQLSESISGNLKKLQFLKN